MGKLSLTLKTRDRTVDELSSRLEMLACELREEEQAWANTCSELAQEEQKCERRTAAYKAKNISFHRCKDALVARTDELSEAKQDLKSSELHCERLKMALEDRDIITTKDLVAAAAGSGATVSVGRPERPLLAMLESHDLASCPDTKTEDVLLPAVNSRGLKPSKPKGHPKRRTRPRRDEMSDAELLSTMPGQVFSSWMLVPLQRS